MTMNALPDFVAFFNVLRGCHPLPWQSMVAEPPIRRCGPIQHWILNPPDSGTASVWHTASPPSKRGARLRPHRRDSRGPGDRIALFRTRCEPDEVVPVPRAARSSSASQLPLDWSTTISKSTRNLRASIRGAIRPASAIFARSTNRRMAMGPSSATGAPSRVTTIVWPASTSCKTVSEPSRSCRSVTAFLTTSTVASAAFGSNALEPGRGNA
jgi:hypothetical protein